MKRFRVKDYNGMVTYKTETTKEIYDYLKKNPAIINSYIEDVVDDINWIRDDEFMKLWEEGEYFEDLQIF